MVADPAGAADAALTPRLERFLERARARVDRVLARVLPDPEAPPRRLHAAMRYAVFPGGKRLRPALTLLAHGAAGGRGGGALRAAAAVELVHTFSLIHDDLPCLDDSPTRRGRPSVHCEFDQATALLAGDALFALAFEVLAGAGAGAGAGARAASWPPGAATAIARELARASGPAGMIGGQAAEQELLGRRSSLAALEWVHRRKTGRLFEAAAAAGALAAGAAPERLAVLRRYARHLGLAFQIADDLLDEEVDGGSGGCPQPDRPDTYPGVLGAAGARVALERARAAARRETRRLDAPAAGLAADLADYAAGRTS